MSVSLSWRADRTARDLLIRPENTVPSIARLPGSGAPRVYEYVPERVTGRPAVEPSTARAEWEAGS
ncbi:hypothetical protein GCM10010466_55890 [Planomonospora alba]|uniref:Uncharacterized protein n=1 Tax=Planomonospora alba TaxID=161354 RepID=A0ABP6NVL7_9ACTN